MDEGLIDPAGDAAAPRLPDAAPRAMPDQKLRRWPEPPARTPRTARLAFVALWLLATIAFAVTLYRVLSVQSPTPLQLVFLVLSTLCFAWVAAGSTSSVIGYCRLLAAARSDTIEIPPVAIPSASRTALLFPVYREDATEVAASIDCLCRDIESMGLASQLEVFILSDTQDDAESTAERSAFRALAADFRGRLQIYYRWRTPNLAKKAGNIRDWIERFGKGYSYFVVLDADSIMSADTLSRLVAAMDANPRTGLIQTVPRLIGGTTLFARLQQIASHIYGPIVSAGLAAWHGPGGNYWGHNAIIRTEAFATCAGLPALPGLPPLGGHILSHDFVEAALLRRGGWEVHMAPSLDGSYEGCPPTLSDLIVRDRRWAQGNIQHTRIISAHGLPLLSRVHLLMGVCSYIASPLWALTLVVGMVLAFQSAIATPEYFGRETSLFPRWPVFDAQTALALFVATVLVVHLPKLQGIAWVLTDPVRRRRHGGAARVAGGALLEMLLSTLIAPVLMATQTSAIVAILLGRDAGWGAQRRAGSNATLGTYLRLHRWHTMWGVIGVIACLAISPAVLAWTSPIVAGLLLSAPIAWWTSRPASPFLSRLLRIPEEREPPALLVALDEARARWRHRRTTCS